MSTLNGITYVVSEAIIRDRIKAAGYKDEVFVKEITAEVMWRMADIDIDGTFVQSWNFVEEAYTDACLRYIEDNGLRELFLEEDDTKIFDYIPQLSEEIDEAYRVCSVFEDFLKEKGVKVPNEDRDMDEMENNFAIYGMDYAELLDRVKGAIHGKGFSI